VQPLSERLVVELDAIVGTMDDLLDSVCIDHVHDRHTFVASRYLSLPDGAWAGIGEEQRQIQRRLLAMWQPWWEQVELLFSTDSVRVKKRIKRAAESARRWIELAAHDHSIPATKSQAKADFRRHVEPMYESLRGLVEGQGEVVAVPDSNVLIRSPDISKYGSVLGSDAYTVLLVPGVLGEMDAHKVNHRNDAVREKARRFGSRLRGWRNQGRLADGVKVQGEVFVRVVAKEPSFDQTLSWLDPDVVDDRIVASVLEAQRQLPAALVVILTGDSVMLAKADAANIPTTDTPDPYP